MTFQFGDPPDPVYVAFRTGLHEYFDRWDTRAPVRWAFFRKDWRSYPRDRFSLAETPVAATDPGMAIDPKLDFGPPLRNYLEVHDFELPNLFRRLQETYGRYNLSNGPLVWNPIDGQWRRVIQQASQPHPPPPPPPKCFERLNQINTLVREGKITPADGSRARAEILRDCV